MGMLSRVPVVNCECLAGDSRFKPRRSQKGWVSGAAMSLLFCADPGDLWFQCRKHQVQIPPSARQGAIIFERQVSGTSSFLTFSAAFPYGPLISAPCYPSSTTFPRLGPCLSASVPLDKSARGVQPFQPKGWAHFSTKATGSSLRL